eukprot:5006184-Amphidinium_carterae.1
MWIPNSSACCWTRKTTELVASKPRWSIQPIASSSSVSQVGSAVASTNSDANFTTWCPKPP